MGVAFRKPFSIKALAAGLAGIAAITVLFRWGIPVNASTVGFFYLMAVLGVATMGGFRVSVIVSLAAMVCFNFFFLPPVGMLTIADPENWVALFTFLVTALVASHLSDRAQLQAAEAKRRQQETEQLYALSRAILLTESARPIGTQVAQSIAQVFESPTVMILDARTGAFFRGGEHDIEGLEQQLEEVVRLGSHVHKSTPEIDVWPVSLGGNPVGALAAVGIRISDGAVQSMLNLIAIALEQVRSQEAANQAVIARQSEEFKSTLLDAIAHEFKTPLTSIKAAASGLRSIAHQMPADQRELTAIIDEETERLSQLVTEAVKMAEIDAGKVRIHREAVQPAELLRSVRNSFDGRGAERLEIAQTPEERILVDRDLMTLAMRQVVDNALKYSEPGTTVECSATREPSALVIRIADQGPGIPERERERVFDKFYRRASVRDQVPGSGLGLHIAREITRIHGGDLWVEPHAPRGAVFCFQLPLASGASA